MPVTVKILNKQRIYGLEGAGIYSKSFEIYNIMLIISSYSLPIAVARLVAIRTAKKEHRNAYRVFLIAMMCAVIVGFIATLIVFFGADLFTILIKSPNIALPLRVLSPTIFVFSINNSNSGFTGIRANRECCSECGSCLFFSKEF
ncbi:MAG: hypothetical protein K0R00_3021 [Herbinix sp.]|nr:hypothetical protein [Herbinix sp.]